MYTEHKIYLLFGKKMAGHITEKELSQLHTLIAGNPQLHYSLELLHKVWNQHPVTSLPMPEEKYQQLQNRINRHHHPASLFQQIHRAGKKIINWTGNFYRRLT